MRLLENGSFSFRRTEIFFGLVLSLASIELALADQLYLIRPDGSDLQQLTSGKGRGYGSPDWSPDGQRIAFDIWPAGNFRQPRIHVIRKDGTNEKDLGIGAMPSWSPDGKQLVCHTYADINTSSDQIVVMNADGSFRRAILNQWGCPRWNPDGRHIVTCHEGGLARYDLVLDEQFILLSDYFVRAGFSISPEGDRYCVTNPSGGVGIAEPHPSNELLKTRRRLSTDYKAVHSSWSPDSQRVVIVINTADHDSEPKERLFFLAVNSSAEPSEVPEIPVDWRCGEVDWSPDGEWLVFKRFE